MKLKILLITSLLIFCSRVAFSIYFSVNIVDENSLVNQYQVAISDLEIQNQVIENQLATFNSLSNTHPPIKPFLDLR